MSADFKKAENEALNLIARQKIIFPPVNIDKIISSFGLGIELRFFPDSLSDISGFLDIKEKSIYINFKDSPQRQNFTKAHELGHWLLHRQLFETNPKLQHMLRRENKNDTPEEKEANCFAANLLIPPQMLKRAVIEFPWANVEVLAKIFNVSKSYMAHRITNVL